MRMYARNADEVIDNYLDGEKMPSTVRTKMVDYYGNNKPTTACFFHPTGERPGMLFSYHTMFPLALRVAPDMVLYNADKNTPTTGKHQHHLRQQAGVYGVCCSIMPNARNTLDMVRDGVIDAIDMSCTDTVLFWVLDEDRLPDGLKAAGAKRGSRILISTVPNTTKEVHSLDLLPPEWIGKTCVDATLALQPEPPTQHLALDRWGQVVKQQGSWYFFPVNQAAWQGKKTVLTRHLTKSPTKILESTLAMPAGLATPIFNHRAREVRLDSEGQVYVRGGINYGGKFISRLMLDDWHIVKHSTALLTRHVSF